MPQDFDGPSELAGHRHASDYWFQQTLKRTERGLEVLAQRMIASGSQYDPDNESGRLWWLFRGPLTDEQALYLAGNPHEFSSGPGRAFGCAPMIRRNPSGSKVLVTQFTGLDI
jgi:hypothetical protein